MAKYFSYLLGICPGLDLPRGEETTSTGEIGDLHLYPRLYLMPHPVPNVRSVEKVPGPGGEDEVVWMGFEIDTYGVPHQFGYVDPAKAIRGLVPPYPTAIVCTLAYRNEVPQEVYILASKTPYLAQA